MKPEIKSSMHGLLIVLLLLDVSASAGKASCPSLLQRTSAASAHPSLLKRLPADHDGIIELAWWEERIGDNLWQLASVLCLAASRGFHEVRLPSSKGHLHELFELPDTIRTDQNIGPHRLQVFPLLSTSPAGAVVHGTILDPGEVVTSRLLQGSIGDLGTEALRGNCSEDYSAEDVLTVHFRGGDALIDEADAIESVSWADDYDWTPEAKSQAASLFPEYRQPPCAFYESIFNGSWGGTFSRMRLVSQDDTNPCVSWLQMRFPGQVDFEPASEGADACKLIQARYVVFSNSLFSKSFGLWLNENMVKGFIPVEESSSESEVFFLTGFWYNFFLEGAEEGADTKKPKITALEIPGLGAYRAKGDDKKAWMVNYTGHLVQSARPMRTLEDTALLMTRMFPPVPI